jgi:hypothetical protein
MMELNGHEAGNGGHSQGKSKVHRVSSTRRVTTGWWERWPTWATRCPTRPWATFCAGVESPLCPRGARRPPGRTSLAATGTFSPAPTSITVELLTWRGLATYYVLFFTQSETRRITLAGITRHPTAEWMLQMSRNANDEESGHLHDQRYWPHDRDTKFCPALRNVLRCAGVRSCCRRRARIGIRWWVRGRGWSVQADLVRRKGVTPGADRGYAALP